MPHLPSRASLAIVLTLLCACSESRDDTGGGGQTGASSTADATSASNATSTSDASSATGMGGGDPGPALVVVNEISATDDWVELVNLGPGAADLSGWVVADEETPGVPKLTEALTFPEDTSLEEGAYLLVVAKVTDPMPGPQSDCLASGGPDTCYQAAFGISDGSGDGIYLLDADGVSIDEVTYPPGAAADGESWARLPDGEGDFGVSANPSPGEKNGP